MTIKGMKTTLNKLADQWDERYALRLFNNKLSIITKDGRPIESVEIPAKAPANHQRPWHVYPKEKPKYNGYYEAVVDDGTTAQVYWSNGSFSRIWIGVNVLVWREYE